MTTIADRVRDARLAAGLSQTALAGSAFSPSYISLIEAGHREPTDSALAVLAIRLGTTLEFLKHGEDGPNEARTRLEIDYARLDLTQGDAAGAKRRLEVLDLDIVSPALRVEALTTLARAHEGLGDLESAVAILEPLLEDARSRAHHVESAKLANALVASYLEAGDLHRAVEVGEHTLTELESAELTGTDGHLRLASTVLWAYVERGDLLYATHRAAELVRLAESLVSRAAIAVDLSERVSRDALRRAVDAQELERARLARELHDETGQALTSILLGLKHLDDVVETDEAREATASIRELVAATLQDVRRLAVELRPSALDDFGLVPAVERLASNLSEQSDLVVDLEARLGDRRLPPEAETALYRIVQEGLTNVVKHAAAHRVSITLVRKEAAAVVVIEDDGQGFDPEAVRAGALGFTGMRERVELVGGRLTVETSPGAGTTVVAEVHVAPAPLPEEDVA